MTDAQLDALEFPDKWSDVFDESEIAALRLADALCGSTTHDIEPELKSSLRNLYTEAELAELILVCGQANLNNRAGNAAKQLLGEETL